MIAEGVFEISGTKTLDKVNLLVPGTTAHLRSFGGTLGTYTLLDRWF